MSPDPNAVVEFPEVDVPSGAALSRESVVRFLVGALAESCRLSAEQVERITTQVMQREMIGSNGIGGGVAIPHVRADGIEAIAVIVGRLPNPVDWMAIDGEPVNLACLVLSPRTNPGTHLRILEQIVRRFHPGVGG